VSDKTLYNGLTARALLIQAIAVSGRPFKLEAGDGVHNLVVDPDDLADALIELGWIPPQPKERHE
jgi:hypothetical protein